MTTFLNLVATEPEVARIPIMVDSSRWTVLEAGLQCLQGKGIVNSISLKEGEEEFLAQARRDPRLRRRRRRDGVRRGRARPTRSSARSRSAAAPTTCSSSEVGFPPEDIVFDPNVLAVATGIEEHDDFARAFIEALPLIKERCPGARTSRRDLEPQLLVPRQRRRARGDALGVPLPRDPRRARHGDRQRRPARGLRGHRARAPRARRGRASSTAAPDATERLVELAERRARARARSASSTSPGARRRSRSGSSTRSCTGSSTSSRPTPRRRG